MDEKQKPISNLKPISIQRIFAKNLPHWEIPEHAYFITFSTLPEIELNSTAKDIVFSATRFHDVAKYLLYA
jgi:hypothetical protein